jgi:predicted CoA-binding protein
MMTATDHQKRAETIQRLLDTVKTIAVVGLSSKKERPGYYVPAYLQSQGYRIIPVNPYLTEALGEQAYPDLLSVPEQIDLVLLFRRSEAVPPFVEQAIELGAPAVWMQLGIVNQGAAELARQAGLDVVMDACMMIEHRRRRG